MGTQLAPKQHKSPQSPAGSASHADELITSATQKRKRGVDPALVSPTVKRNYRVEVGAPYNPRSLAKIFLGNGQDLVVCRKDASDQQACTTSSPGAPDAAAHPASAPKPEPAPADDTSSGTHIADPAEQAAVQHLPSTSSSKQQTSSEHHAAEAALAESELMAENVPEAVQRLTSSDATASSSAGADATTPEGSDPDLTSPTSLALPASEAYHHVTYTQDDDSDSEYGLEFNPYSFLRTLPPLAEVVDKHQKPLLPPQTRRFSKKTLVLDLDETLVHSTLDGNDAADFKFTVKFNSREHSVAVRQRPFLFEFLERVAQLFEVVVFTASQKVYAEQLLNILDPKRRLIRHRVFRDDCVIVSGNYLKNLTVLGRDLSQTMIVDNSPQAFGFQLSNGIPIESWYDDESDTELQQLLPFLEHLADVPDVRVDIEQKYQLYKEVEKAPKQLFSF